MVDADFLSFLESMKAPIVKQDINNSERKFQCQEAESITRNSC